MIPDGITRDHVFAAIKDFETGTVEHGFAGSVRYDLLVGEHRYPPKAILGLAARYVLGQPLSPADFSGGEAHGCNRTLRELGFRIVPKPGLEAVGVFDVGERYTRNDIYAKLSVPEESQRGHWDTGYHHHRGEWFIFSNVGEPGRTGHDYPNRFEGNDLIWTGKNGSKITHKQIQGLVSGEEPVHIFFRLHDREPFQYAGLGSAAEIWENEVPVRVRWSFEEPAERRPERLPEEIVEPEQYVEGARQQVTVNSYERNPAARRRCLEVHGVSCAGCGFNFETTYGEIGKGFIHVHHLKPLASIGTEYQLDPVNDLRPLCPNCHAVVHRQNPTLSLDELRNMIQARAGKP